jgi:hypothetical protein
MSDSVELLDARRKSDDKLISRDGELLDELAVSRGGDGSGDDIVTKLPGTTTGPADGSNMVDRGVNGGGGMLIRCEVTRAARSAADVLQTSRRSCTCASSSLQCIKLLSESSSFILNGEWGINEPSGNRTDGQMMV